MQTFDLAKAIGRFNVIRQLARADLLDVLRQAAPDLPLRTGTAVTEIVEHGDEVEVLAGTTSLGRFDLVVGADGIHSRLRRHVAGEVDMKETGWGGWVWWAPANAAPHEAVTEYWGASRCLCRRDREEPARADLIRAPLL